MTEEEYTLAKLQICEEIITGIEDYHKHDCLRNVLDFIRYATEELTK